jgi:hypothetical protein
LNCFWEYDGWPTIPLLRRLGIRTREEMDRERYALKALAGDFESVARGSSNIERAFRWGEKGQRRSFRLVSNGTSIAL